MADDALIWRIGSVKKRGRGPAIWKDCSKEEFCHRWTEINTDKNEAFSLECRNNTRDERVQKEH
jgi:hypothetical protein